MLIRFSPEMMKPIASLFKTESAEVVDRISTKKVGVPKLLKQAGTGAGALTLFSAGVYGSGKLVGSGLEAVGLKNKSSAELFNQETEAMKSRLELAKEINSYQNDQILYGRTPYSLTDQGENYLLNKGNVASDNQGKLNLGSIAVGSVIVIALLIGGTFAFKQMKRKGK